MGADKLFHVKSIATYAPTFFGYIISVLAIVIIISVSVERLQFYALNFYQAGKESAVGAM